MVGVSASVNLSLHHKDQKFSSLTGSPGWSRKKGRETVVMCGTWCVMFLVTVVASTTEASSGSSNGSCLRAAAHHPSAAIPATQSRRRLRSTTGLRRMTINV